ncbi:hypothetical protein DYB38_005932, partial [Aphanomyces astaci]
AMVPVTLLMADVVGDRQVTGSVVTGVLSSGGLLVTAVYIAAFGPAHQSLKTFLSILIGLLGTTSGTTCWFITEVPLQREEGPPIIQGRLQDALVAVYTGIRQLPSPLGVYFLLVMLTTYGYTSYNGAKGQFFGLVVKGGTSSGADVCGAACSPAQVAFNDGVRVAGLTDSLQVVAFVYVLGLPCLVHRFGTKRVVAASIVPQMFLVLMAMSKNVAVDVAIAATCSLTQATINLLIVPLIVHVKGHGQDNSLGLFNGALNSAVCGGQLLNYVASAAMVTSSMGYALPVLVGGIVSAVAFCVALFKFHISMFTVYEPASEPPAAATPRDISGEGVYVTRKRSIFSKWLHGKGAFSSPANQPAPVFRSADVIQEGYMLKQGSRFRMLTKRYFILRLEEKHMTLGYYTSKEALVLCSETPIGPGHALYDISVEGHHRLELRHGTTSLIVEVETEADFVKWKNCLQEAVRWHQAMVFDGANKVTSYGKKCLDDEAAEALARQEAAKKQRETVAKKAQAAATANANKPKFLPSTRPGYQCFTVSNTKFEIPVDYSYVKTIGSGAYGVVIAAEKDGRQVAIKNIQRAFDDLTDAKRIVREIKLMRHFTHKCLLGVDDILEPVEIATFDDVYIVSECMATDLHRVIYSRHPLSEEHICFFLYQMLMVVLLYRAPEIMLGCMKYTRTVDVWSLGCIFAEMLSRKPLFPGQDYIDQLHLIMNALGVPSDDELYFVTNARARKFMNTEYHTRPLAALFPDISADAMNLLERMLVVDPHKRIEVEAALGHPYFASIRTVEDETVASTSFDFEFESEELTKRRLQELIWDEMRVFHPIVS